MDSLPNPLLLLVAFCVTVEMFFRFFYYTPPEQLHQKQQQQQFAQKDSITTTTTCTTTSTNNNRKVVSATTTTATTTYSNQKTPHPEDFFNSPVDEAGTIEVQGRSIPWTLTSPDYSDSERSYLVSPYAQYISYAYDEIKNYGAHSPLKVWIGNAIIWCVSIFLRLTRIDDCIYFNNRLCTTCLWPGTINWSEDEIQKVNETLLLETAGKKSGKAIIWRCIDPLSQPVLTRALSESSCLLVPSRVVNWIELGKEKLKQHRSKKMSFKRDIRLCKDRAGFDFFNQTTVKGSENCEYEIVAIEPEDMTMEIAQKLIVLYNQLYLGKYSKCNPQPTPQGLCRVVKSGLFVLYALRLRSEPDRFLSFAGGYEIDNVSTFPFAGYDRAYPEQDLYRLLIAMTLHHAIRNGNDKQHMSGGVSQFKRNRGATTSVEYIAVFVDHLPMYQRLGWKLLKVVTDRIITVKNAK